MAAWLEGALINMSAQVPGAWNLHGSGPLRESYEALVEDNIIIPSVEYLGGYFLDGLRSLQKKYSFVKDVRGKGLLLGMELDFPGKDIVTACLREGLLINCTMDTVLRFMPPLIITQEEIARLVGVLDKIFAQR